MHQINKPHIRFWFFIGIAILALIMGAGFYQNLSADSDEIYKGLKLFSDVIDLVEKNYVDPVDPKELIEKAIQGMVSSLDPHSALLTPEAFKELQIDTQGKFTGIGIHITMRDGFVTVISPIEGTPAYKAGIKAMDKIIKVDQTPTNDLRDAVNRMRGPKGTTVVVTIIRENEPEPIDFTLVRDVIPIESVKAAMLQPGYGYIWITNFRDQTTEDLESALKKMESLESPLKGLVLDLRDNPGGILNQAIAVSDLFIDNGTILTIKGRQEKHSRTFTATPNSLKREYPMVVLINGGSASASEIVAGALQDHKRALILGTPSFGKGSVQTVETLRDGYGLKFTIARYYTPSGRSIQAKGVLPDITVEYKEMVDTGAADQSNRVLKEKDLKNHLESRPLKENTLPETPVKGESIEEIFHGQTELSEKIHKDNQVMRGLEILISYDIFKDLNNG
jgi:carboxyl-terminal processing protease